MLNWFYDLKSKTKLFILSASLIILTIIVAAISYKAVTAAVQASEDITVVINRSAARINALEDRLEAFDDTALAFMGYYLANESKFNGNMRVQYLQEADKIFQEIQQRASVINPNFIGNFDAPPAHHENLTALKKGVVDMQKSYETYRSRINTSVRAGIRQYLMDFRPQITQALERIKKGIDTADQKVISLADEGSDMRLAYLCIIAALIAVAVGTFLSWAISAYIVRCLNSQEKYLEEMCKGNFAFKVKTGHKDDMGEIINLIEQTRSTLNKALIEVIANSRKTRTSLGEVTRMSSEIGDKVADCEGKSITVSAASEQMLATTQDIAKNCEDASNMSQSTKGIIDSGVHQIQNTIGAIREQSTEMQANSTAVEKVAKRSLDINSIVNTINEIAAQTNLLALNAAIEAARAGEAGRGFAVVADEVRALASRTSASTQEIAGMVADIQTDAAAAAESIHKSVDRIEKASTDTAQVEATMKEMISHIDEVTLQITQIASAAEEQTSATNEISQHIQDISSLTKDVNDDSQNTLSIIDDTVNALNNLTESLKYFTLERN